MIKRLFSYLLAIRTILLLIASVIFDGGCAQNQPSLDVARFQPEIIETAAPDPLPGHWSIYNNTRRVGLADILPIVPAFNGNGKLLASWNPHPDGIKNRPTLVVVHGGFGLSPTHFSDALWAREQLDANVLILDSYWSMGRQENWATATRYGANMRALDVVAAGRWLLDLQGTDPSKTFLYGGSQGGWTVLRAFTEEPLLQREIPSLYRGGIALYPNCKSDGSPLRPKLGPYFAPVIVFTGGRDEGTPISECEAGVFNLAERWIHFEFATHGWDVANRGAGGEAVDGKCGVAENPYRNYPVCRSNEATEATHRISKEFIMSLSR